MWRVISHKINVLIRRIGMQGNGIITAVNDNSVEIAMESHSGCDKCGLCMIEKNNVKKISLPFTGEDIREGDRVILSISGQHAVLVSLFTYIVPLVCMLAGYGIGAYLFRSPAAGGEGLPILISFLFLGGSFGGLKYLDRYFVKRCLPAVTLKKQHK